MGSCGALILREEWNSNSQQGPKKNWKLKKENEMKDKNRDGWQNGGVKVVVWGGSCDDAKPW